MILSGFQVRGFRSIGQSGVKLDRLGKVNLLIGPNNSGKSNILRLVHHLSLIDPPAKYVGFHEVNDRSSDASVQAIEASIHLHPDFLVGKQFYDQLSQIVPDWPHLIPPLRHGFWLDFTPASPKSTPFIQTLQRLQKLLRQHLDIKTIAKATDSLKKVVSGDPNANVSEIATALLASARWKYTAHLIEALRRITPERSAYDLSGSGLIHRLRQLQHPNSGPQYQEKIRLFDSINEFFKEVVESPTARIEVPAEEDEVLVHLNDRILPLSSLGTGIHQVVLLGSAVSSVSGHVFCIEEPELHLHPTLQRKLLRHISLRTENQYFISTHSNVALDIEGGKIIQTRLENNFTACTEVASSPHLWSALADLGYRASDILQANYVIWVEGPSDRIYLRHWLNSAVPGLAEGLDFAIMFYGGRLLNHLAYDNADVNRFINLAMLSRNAAILIDSDRPVRGSHLNPTKIRVRQEFEDNGALVWITGGRTIENYVPKEAYQECVRKVHPRVSRFPKHGRYNLVTKVSGVSRLDKVAVARAVAEFPANLTCLDLAAQLHRLANSIKRSGT